MGRFTGKKLPELNGSKIAPPARLTRRSSVTNGKRLFIALKDGDSPWSRRLHDLIALHVADLGGASAISESEKMLVRRASMLCLQCELLERKWVKNNEGEASEKSLLLYQRCVGSLRRCLKTLGLQRRSRDITPSLDAYLSANHPEPAG